MPTNHFVSEGPRFQDRHACLASSINRSSRPSRNSTPCTNWVGRVPSATCHHYLKGPPEDRSGLLPFAIVQLVSHVRNFSLIGDKAVPYKVTNQRMRFEGYSRLTRLSHRSSFIRGLECWFLFKMDTFQRNIFIAATVSSLFRVRCYYGICEPITDKMSPHDKRVTVIETQL